MVNINEKICVICFIQSTRPNYSERWVVGMLVLFGTLLHKLARQVDSFVELIRMTVVDFDKLEVPVDRLGLLLFALVRICCSQDLFSLYDKLLD